MRYQEEWVMSEKPTKYTGVEELIITIRDQRVILDADIALLYGVSTKHLNQQVKRNLNRFPPDFMFQLSKEEVVVLNRSQIVTGSQKHRDPRFLPYAFTEHGALMAANVLNSAQAVEMSLFIVRAFVKMRERLVTTHLLEKHLAAIDRKLLSHDASLRDVYE